MPSTSLVIPTYRRPDRLARCLVAIERLDATPLEVIVVRSPEDLAAAAIIEAAGAPVRELVVPGVGVLAKMISGAAAARGALIGFLDDDAEPEPTWLRRIEATFADPDVGLVSGRDRVFEVDDRPARHRIGHIASYGRITGDHHLGAGAAREVDVLKGANLVARRAALALPLGLRGLGAQVHWEVATSLFAAHGGWKVVYDPSARVDHLPGPRFDADRRDTPELTASHDSAHNMLHVLLGLHFRLGLARGGYGVLVGDRGNPGMMRAALLLVVGDHVTARKFGPSMRGMATALVAHCRGRRVRLVVFPAPPRS